MKCRCRCRCNCERMLAHHVHNLSIMIFSYIPLWLFVSWYCSIRHKIALSQVMRISHAQVHTFLECLSRIDVPKYHQNNPLHVCRKISTHNLEQCADTDQQTTDQQMCWHNLRHVILQSRSPGRAFTFSIEKAASTERHPARCRSRAE